jgi:hypothetical protein
MKLSERKEILKKSGLCLFCLRHAAEVECYGQGSFSKPKCAQVGCNGEHTPSVHELLGEESAVVNLVTEGEYESEEDEEWWVGTIRIEEGEETLEEMDESEPEREVQHSTSVFTRKDDSELEDEFEYFWEAHIPSDPDEPEEDRWWSPEPPEPSSEEDEEEVRYLTEVFGLEPQGNKARQGESPASAEAVPRTEAGSPTPPDVERQEKRPGTPAGREPPRTRKSRRRKLRKKVTKD